MPDASREQLLGERPSHIEPKTGPPAHATDQRMRVLQILEDAALVGAGVYRELFLIPVDLGGHGISQVSTRINELRRQGCVVDSRRARPTDKFVTYYLRFVPERLEERPQDKNPSADWYEEMTGRKRPTGQAFGPPFDAMESRR